MFAKLVSGDQRSRRNSVCKKRHRIIGSEINMGNVKRITAYLKLFGADTYGT